MLTVTPAKNYAVVFPAQIVSTSGPVFSDAVKCGQVNQNAIYVSFTKGNLDGGGIAIQVSYDGENWFFKPVLDIAAGSGGGDFYLIPVSPSALLMESSQDIVVDVPSCYQYLRVAIFGQGADNTGSSMTISIGSGSI